MKTLLITGAFGLVGYNICKVLERDYPDIKVTKVKHTEHLSGTYLDSKFANESFDFVVYASGYGQPAKFSQDKIETIKTACGWPLEGAFRLLKKDGKFLYVSSAEVYSGAKSPYKETDIGTTTPQHPRACYIEGKRCGEAICMAYKEQGFDVKIARLALAYGEGTKKNDTRVLNQFIQQALTEDCITLRDTGKAMRTYCYIDDAVGMLLNILFKGTKPVYNVGGISRTSIRDLAISISKITKCVVSIPTNDTGQALIDAPDDVQLAMWNTLEEFPKAFVDLETGLKRTIEYQKQLYGIN